MEVSGQLHAPAALPPGKEPLVPIGEEGNYWSIIRGSSEIMVRVPIKSQEREGISEQCLQKYMRRKEFQNIARKATRDRGSTRPVLATLQETENIKKVLA
jgi:hypothetical protein